MKFLFINKPFSIEPLGIMYVASSIKNAGHDIDLALTSEDLEKKVEDYNPDFIGYSIMTGDQDFYDNLNKKLKANHIFFSIAGGPHPTFFPEMLKKSSFDAICRGEGENVVRQLLESPESKEVSNCWFKSGGKIIENLMQPLMEDLDKIAFPNREVVFKYSNIQEGPIKHFIASRGCPFNCSYCFNKSYSELYEGKGKRVRFRSVNNLLDEVQEVISSSPTKFIYFQDDTFILKPEWLKEFSEKYKEKIDLPFHCHTRANLVTEDIVKDLKSAGCYSVHIAAESGNEEVRSKVLNRHMSDEQIYHAADLLKKYGIKTMLQNILGLPFTKLKNDFETLELNIRCQPDYAWASIFQPYPKTELGEECVKSGIYKGDFSDINNNFFDSSVLDIENKNEIANLQKLFAIAVKHPQLYYSGRLQRLIQLPYQDNREKLGKMYNDFRRRSDRILYGFEL
jgi:anaerobic magnesium-protoporphyrin IX monomethyl ester cyclase